MKTIAFVMPKLGGGGAERVVSIILRHIDKSKFEVHLIIVHDGGEYESMLPQEVKVTKLPISQVRFAAPLLIKEIRKIKPDIVFSSIRGLSTVLGVIKPFLPKKTKMIFRENNTPSVSIADSKFPFIWKIIYKTIFTKVDRIICQSDFMFEDFKKEFGVSEDKLIRIYNPVDIDMVRNMSNQKESPFNKDRYKNVVVVAKMMPQKGIDLLLESIAKYKERTKDVKVWIIGDGKYYDDYLQLSRELKVSNKVNFMGRQNNPFVWIKHADLFLLPSRYEGLPNVVLEAFACGCPVITTNHPGGTKEIMELTGNQLSVVENLDWDNSWFDLRNEISSEFEKTFRVENIIRHYEKLFLSV